MPVIDTNRFIIRFKLQMSLKNNESLRKTHILLSPFNTMELKKRLADTKSIIYNGGGGGGGSKRADFTLLPI